MSARRKALYLRAISLIDEYFRSQGIEITIGFELEFLAPRPADETGRKFFGEIIKPTDDMERHVIPDDKLPEYLSKFRGVIQEIYKKRGGVIDVIKEVPVDKYEVILCPMPPLDAISATERVKTIIIKDILPELQINDWAQRVSFGTSHGRITPALHTNIGMTCGGKEIFKQSDFEPTDFMLALAEAMKATIYESTALVSPFPSSYERYSSDAHISYPKKVAVNPQSYSKDGSCIGLKYREVSKNHCMFPQNGKGSFQYVHWIENRLPSGDCQPYVAAFTTLLAAYDAFKGIAKFDAQGKIITDGNNPQLNSEAIAEHKNYLIPQSLEDSIAVFTAGRILQYRLNELDKNGNLGTDLYDMEVANQIKVLHKIESLPVEERSQLGALR